MGFVFSVGTIGTHIGYLVTVRRQQKAGSSVPLKAVNATAHGVFQRRWQQKLRLVPSRERKVVPNIAFNPDVFGAG
jgi:hypothetical protein